MDCAIVLIGPGGVREQPLDRRIDLLGGRLGTVAGGGAQPLGELVGARAQVLGDIVQDLRAVVRRLPGPSRRRARRLDGVADVLAIAIANLADQMAARIVYRAAVARIRPGLLTADVVLGRAIERGQD